MGTVISFWSSSKKQGKTIFLYFLINKLKEQVSDNISILSLCMNMRYGNLLDFFGIDKKELSIEDIVNFKINPNNSFNYDIQKVIAKRDNLYFIGSKMMNINYANRNIRSFEELITQDLKNNFDIILVDTISGDENTLTNMINENSDFIINILSQDKEMLDKSTFVTEKDLAYIINFYRNIYPSEKELISLYKLKSTFILPLCNDLQEMKNKNKLEYYIQHNTEYNNKILEISNFIVQKLGLEIKYNEISQKPKKFLLKEVLWGKYDKSK